MWTLPLLPSGIAPIDERLGGLTPGRPHLVTGLPGSGKSSVCLSFLGTALANGASAALLTQDEPADVVAHAADLGIDLRAAETAGRLVTVRFRSDFVARLSRAASAELVVEELLRALAPIEPERLVVDSVMPFLDASSAAGSGIAALVDALDRLKRTTLVTYPGDVRDRYDQRLDALVRRCAAVLHLSSCGEGIGRIDLVKSRARLWSDAPGHFRIRPGRGVVALDEGEESEGGATSTSRRRVLLVPGAEGVPDDLRAALGASFPVSVHDGAATVMPRAMGRDVGAIVVAARWSTIPGAASLLAQLRGSGDRTPAILLTRGDVRSSDRARAVLAGFDDVVGHAAGTRELLARVTAAMRRGRSTGRAYGASVGHTTPAEPERGSAIVEDAELRATIDAAIRGTGDRLFCVLFLSPGNGDVSTLLALAAHTVRATSGDLVAGVGERVAVYLPGTRRTEAGAVVRRLRDAWHRESSAALRITPRVCPADRELLRADLRTTSTSVAAG